MLKKTTFIAANFAFLLSANAAGELLCATNQVTQAKMCFNGSKVRSNGEVRSSPFYTGGPKQIDDTGYTARVHCLSRVLELTDTKGVAFIRNVPTEQIGRDFVQFLCEHQKTKKDPSLALR